MAKWQPIETAPKDGTHVLLGRTPPWSASANVCVGFWADEHQANSPHWKTENGFMVDVRIYRLWMPLPDPPTAD